MNITAKELSGVHLGQTVTVTLDSSSATGILAGINQEHQKIYDPTWEKPNKWELGRLDMQLILLLETGFIEINARPNTPITIQEGE